jgi:hypothetical protein
MGYLFSTLFQLRHQYSENVADESQKFWSPPATNILADINHRFKEYSKCDDASAMQHWSQHITVHSNCAVSQEKM